jgi:hypothetical protein
MHGGRATAIVMVDDACERLSISNGFSRIRVDITSGTLLAGPVMLRFMINDDRYCALRQLTLTQFRAFRRTGRLDHSLHRVESRAARWILQLRAVDGLQKGATSRELAAILFSGRARSCNWREDDSLRSTVRRLVANARQMVAGGYRKLLR